jgi:hypothetical protein
MSKNPNQPTFQRFELKYLLSDEQYRALLYRLAERIEPDEFYKSTICNLYFDTPDYRLIRTSLEKPVYKEKLRLRSYGVPTPDGKVFLEIKKKYKGVVYKRRIALTLTEAQNYLSGGIRPAQDSQILREIDWFRAFYSELQPAVYLSYDREAYAARENAGLRFTFDTNILYRRERLHLADGVGGQALLEAGQHLMELKVPGAMPVWLAGILSSLSIRPVSYSKYGSAYRQFRGAHPLLRVTDQKEGVICA